MGTVAWVFNAVKHLVHVIVEPLRKDESLEHFTLAIPEAQTTTVDSVQGWQNRPPAVLECPGCGSEMRQHNAIGPIACQSCWREFPSEEFADHELLAMICPRCDADMHHGRRHPQMFDIPEWATCPDCQYHWDLDHWFKRRR
jgi:Zn ribbon nucleic-acid-binding protein